MRHNMRLDLEGTETMLMPSQLRRREGVNNVESHKQDLFKKRQQQKTTS